MVSDTVLKQSVLDKGQSVSIYEDVSRQVGRERAAWLARRVRVGQKVAPGTERWV